MVLVSAGHAPLFEHLLAHLKVTRGSAGAPRTVRDRVRADKAYSSRAIRAELRRRGITAVIPEPSDQIAHRKRRGSRWPATSFRRRRLQGRNVIERGFNTTKQWRGLATRATTNSPPTVAQQYSEPSRSGCHICQTRPSREVSRDSESQALSSLQNYCVPA